MIPTKALYIGGELEEGRAGTVRDVLSPVSEEVIGRVAFAGKEDVNGIVGAAQRGFRSWRAMSLAERRGWMLTLREALLKEKEELLQLLMLETGKQRAVAMDDFDKLQSGLGFFPEAMAELTGELIPDREDEAEHRIVYSPIGPVAAYLAWNFPLLNLGYKLGPVLAAGCSIVVKPSVLTPLSNYRIGEICREIGFPAGVINIAAGDNAGFGEALSAHKGIAGITMIGSTPSALRVIRSSTTSIKRFSMELGGNAPFIVFDDADLEKALDLLMNLKTANTGQICVSPNRILLQEGIAPRFTEDLVKRCKAVKLGDPLRDDNVMGPLISAEARERVADYVKRAVGAGAKKYCDNEAKLPERGYFYPVTVLTECTVDNPAFSEEVFGPVVSVGSFSTEEEAIEIANHTRAGLASYIFSKDNERIHRVSGALEFGEVMINGCKWDIYLPHVGMKDSGFGADCSQHALHDYLNMRRISTMHLPKAGE